MVSQTVPLTPLSFLRRSADVFSSDVAVVDTGGDLISYAELGARAAQLADALRAAGVNPGDRVAVLAANTSDLLTAHFGVPGAGAILVALNTRLGPSEYTYILNHSGARILLVDSALAPAIAAVRDSMSSVLQLVELGDGSALSDFMPYAAWVAQASTGPGLVSPADENESIAVNYTSGTSGRPKGVVYTHRGAYLNSLGTAISFGLTRESRYLWTLPMFHCNGWCFTWGVTAVGGQHICVSKIDYGDVLRIIAERRVTHFCAAPVVLNGLVNHADSRSVRYSQRVKVATGGSPPSPATISKVRAMGMELTHLYGLTETYGPSLMCEPQAIWSSYDDDALAATMARQGVRTVTVENVRVVDADFRDVPPDGISVGQIVVRSNSVMAGYLHDDAATSAALHDGWLLTGDLAVVHADGYIEIHDRAKDVIITGGENVSSVEVENVLMSVPGVLEAAVVGRSDETWGEVPVAFVTLLDDADVSAQDLVEHVRSQLAHFKAPRDVIFTTLPKTSTGKIQKSVLRERVRRSPEAPIS